MAVGETRTVAAADESGGRLDPEIRLLVPENDVAEPELSIVIPAFDEEITVGEFVDWCRQGLDAAGVVGEVLIVDSSSDEPQGSRSRTARACCRRRGAGSGVPTSTPCRMRAGSTS